MATLESISGASLVPQTGAIVQQTADRVRAENEALRVRAEEQQKQARIQSEIDILTGEGQAPGAKPNNQQAALLRLIDLNPAIGKAALDVIKSGNAEDRELFRAEVEKGARNAAFVAGKETFAEKQKAITSLANAAAARGEPLDRFIQLQNLSGLY